MVEEKPTTNGTGEAKQPVQEIEEQVRGIREGVDGAVASSSLDEKVETLRGSIRQVAEDLSEWQALPRGVDVETFQNLRQQVEEVQTEWQSLSSSLQSQRERLDALLQTFPGAAEISTIHTLTLRVSNLEGLMDQLLAYHRAEEARRTSRTQIWLSVAALAATVVLWGAFLLYNILGK